MSKKESGFAITTMLYGLLIIASLVTFMLLGLVSFNKKSSSNFVNDVEDEMLTYSKYFKCPYSIYETNPNLCPNP